MNEKPKKLSNSVWVGVIILAIGSVSLINRLDLFDFPRWLFSFPSLLVAVGIIIGVQKKFQGIGWLILVLVGGVFLIDRIPGIPYELERLMTPIVIIIVGGFIVGRSLLGGASRSQKKKQYER